MKRGTNASLLRVPLIDVQAWNGLSQQRLGVSAGLSSVQMVEVDHL